MSEPAVGSPLSMHDPRHVGPWTIHSRLGAGGMGVVFYASSPGYEGAALKVIRPGLLDAPATRDRFRREVAILRSVHDAHISQFLAADLESEPAWLAIEYVAGLTRATRSPTTGHCPRRSGGSLLAAWPRPWAGPDKHRITHRDLKPGNVILGEHGPELIDFGIAHPEDATSLTATGLATEALVAFPRSRRRSNPPVHPATSSPLAPCWPTPRPGDRRSARVRPSPSS